MRILAVQVPHPGNDIWHSKDVPNRSQPAEESTYVSRYFFRFAWTGAESVVK